jgi:phosphopantothenoylcysteine decarboxylase/phosphopantothenate--cysteine ligase
MHTEMWEHASVQENIATLRRRGVHILEPETGRRAGGDVGAGRLADPQRIYSEVEQLLTPGDLHGTHVVITAGGTREPIDAVRVIANRSTGKQGYAIATEAVARGAKVTLISTSDLPTPFGVNLVQVETAQQMMEAVNAEAKSADVVVMAAAVADVRPVRAAMHKLKKDPQTGLICDLGAIELEATPDILAGLGKCKPAGQVLVGFAAETENLVAHAQSKLERKGADLIVANDVSQAGVGFAHSTNAVTLVARGTEPVEVALADKRSIARSIVNAIVAIRSARTN